jgi:SAM-dependent MidA family methyltransferase
VTLREKIADEIRRLGPIPFSRYMEMCLYDPQLGYYSQNAEQFGKAGDFYTSSDVHAVFGRLISRQFDEMWRGLGSPSHINIVELGPGRGLFAQDVLDWSQKKFPDFFHAIHCVLVESSPALRTRLAQTLKNHIRTGKAEVVPDLPGAFEHATIIFANEFFDALPVKVLSSAGELRIDLDNGRLVEKFGPPCPATLRFLDHYSVHPQPGERVEVALAAQQYVEDIATRIGLGFVVAIDYGYTREEQLAGRHLGTVTAFRKHSVNANSYQAPGEQDITAHVNFTALQAAAEKHGMEMLGLVTQSQFLMGIGEQNQFADAFEECRLPQERAKVALQLKHLVTPAGMGETFHVFIMSKGIKKGSAARLSGLTFAR